MKTIAACGVAVLLVVIVLRSELTPWRIVNQAQLTEMEKHVAELQAAAALARSAPVTPAESEPKHGAWMFDPSYRTPLEKTTGVGGPERAKSRDSSRR